MKHLACLIISFVSFVTSFAQSSDSASFYLQKGLHLKEERKWQQARISFEKAARFDATNIAIISAMAEMAMETNNTYQAIEAYLKWHQLQPQDADPIRDLAKLYFYAGRYQDALSFAQRWETMQPSKPLHYIVGMSNYHLEHYPNAIHRLLHAAEVEPVNAYLFYTIGRSYIELERYEKAIPYYLKAADIDTSNARYMYELALIYYAVPNDMAAIKAFETAASRGWKQDADFDENLGYCYLNVKKFNEAISLFKRSLEKKPYNPSVQFVLAETYYKSGSYQAAIEQWDVLLQQDNRNAKALYMIGMSYLKMGQKEKGTALCDKAIAMDPSLSSLRQKKMNMGL